MICRKMFVVVLLVLVVFYGEKVSGDQWSLLQSNTGVSAMHMQLLNNDRVVVFDLTDFGPSNLPLPNNRCRDNPNDLTLQHDCTAHSYEYDIASNSIRPLFVQTNVWCSSGAAMPDGSLMQTGGFNDGYNNVRIFNPCNDGSCDWQELNRVLIHRRWYASNHILPSGQQIIFGGRDRFSFEFYPKRAGTDQAYELAFLSQTRDPSIENNLYPFVFLNTDGNLFLFANNRSILFDYTRRVVVRTYPVIPGGDPRNYPSSGSAVLLPLSLQVGGGGGVAEVLVCGGAPRGSFTSANNRNFVAALNTCGRMRINDANPQWLVETMPSARVMGDMVLLPNGNVLLVNGAGAGTAGWGIARNPVLAPVVYRPGNAAGSRFQTQNATTIPRMYHSTAILLRDGRVLVSGSNPNAYYNFTGVLYPTDLTMQAYSPEYLDAQFARVRPTITSPASRVLLAYGQQLSVDFSAVDALDTSLVRVTMVAPPFTTHSYSMNQRLLVLSRATGSAADVTSLGGGNYRARVLTPASGILAPPGFYLMFVVYQEVPSRAIWVQIN